MKNFQKISLLLLFVAIGTALTSPIQARFFGKDMMKGVVAFSETDGCDDSPEDDTSHQE